jgi:hypothetical protein
MTAKNTMVSGLGILGVLAIALWAADAGAYPTYSQSKVGGVPTGNCVSCHGDFQAVPYTSFGQGVWAGDLMGLIGGDGHLTVISDCSVCHGAGFYPVSTFDSASAEFGMSCLGCHGRFETALGLFEASGLRQHHYNEGITSCAGCHPLDSNPASYTPEGEDILPPYYDVNLAVVALTDPCNPGGVGEDFAAATAGLDNDGDLLYDEADPDCVVPPEGCEFDWPSITINTIAKGQSATQNAKIEHDITGNIVGGADAYGGTAHRIKICAGTAVEIAITCNDEGCPGGALPTITKQVGGDFCDGTGCSLTLGDKFKYVVKSVDVKDTDAVTLLPQ